MPATQRGHARRLQSGKWQLRYYGADGNRKTGGTFPTKTAALDYYRETIAPWLNGGVKPNRDLTLQERAEIDALEAELGPAHADRRVRRRHRAAAAGVDSAGTPPR